MQSSPGALPPLRPCRRVGTTHGHDTSRRRVLPRQSSSRSGQGPVKVFRTRTTIWRRPSAASRAVIPSRGATPGLRVQRLPLGQRTAHMEDLPQLRGVCHRSPPKTTGPQGPAPGRHGMTNTKRRGDRRPDLQDRDLRVADRRAVSRRRHRDSPPYPGFVMYIPDVYRAKVFLEELKDVRAERASSRTSSTCSCRATTPAAPGPACRRPARWSPTTTWRWAGWSRR